MAGLTSPLLSLGARGTIGKSITYSSWKGLAYARQRVVPANPKTTAQVAVRGTFKWVHDAFKFMPSVVTQNWVSYAKGKPLTGPNAFQQANMPVLIGQTVITDIVFSKPTNGGPPTPGLTATPGSGSVSLAPVIPTLPPGWTIVQAIGVAMMQQNPSTESEQVTAFAQTASSSPWTVSITGLLHSQVYVCSVFFKYLRPDGVTAYGGGFNALATTT